MYILEFSLLSVWQVGPLAVTGETTNIYEEDQSVTNNPVKVYFPPKGSPILAEKPPLDNFTVIL
jgi:hypothetical protein